MDIKFKFIGTMRLQVGGKSELVLDVPENSTMEEALSTLGVNDTAIFKFTVVNDEKVSLDYVLQPGDEVKVFPRSFGG
jgi:molybdopterin converting factor small subunit